MPDVITSTESPHLLEAWKMSEEVAMHFNDLLLGFRLKAVGGIALGATAAIGLKLQGSANAAIISGAFAGLAVIWALMWLADFFYYYRLLAGAVDELLRLERQLGDVCLSHQIEWRVRGKRPAVLGAQAKDLPCIKGATGPSPVPSWPVWLFYVLPLLLLIFLSFSFASSSVQLTSAPPPSAVKSTPSGPTNAVTPPVSSPEIPAPQK